MVLLRWNFSDALFMVLTTVTTVGYEEVHPLGEGGRIFTMTVIVFGVGTMLYTLATFGELLVEGHLARYARMRGMERRIAGLSDHFVICGYARMGTRVAQEFRQIDQSFVMVENNLEPLERLRTSDLLFVEGDGASDESLLKAGILRAKGLVSAVDSDERNVFITLTARSLNPALNIVARSSYPDSVEKLRRTGARHRAAAEAVAAALALRYPNRFQVDCFDPMADPHVLAGRLTALYGPVTRRLPFLWSAAYHATNLQPTVRLFQHSIGRGLRRKLRAALDPRPALVASFHPLLNHVAVDVLPYGVPRVTVITDWINFHQAWTDLKADCIICPSQAAYDLCRRRGVPADRLVRAGLPIHPRFQDAIRHAGDKPSMRL